MILNKFFPVLIFCLLSMLGKAQIIWSESFDSSQGCMVNNQPFSWSITDIGTQGSHPNQWYIYSPVNCSQPNTCFTLNTDTLFGALYISYGDICDSANIGPKYRNDCNNTTHKRVESPIIDCTGKNDINLEFDYLTLPYNHDYANVVFSDDGGSNWYDIGPQKLSAGYCPQSTFDGYWKHIQLSLPAAANNNPNVRIGFVWRNNDDCYGREFSVAIDNVTLSSCDLTAEIALENIACAGWDLVTGSADPNLTYFWDLGDGTTSTLPNIQAAYTDTGTFTLTLIATDQNGCTDTVTQVMTVKQGYDFSIGASDITICPSDSVDFTSTVTPALTSPTYNWSFGGGSPIISSVEDPTDISFNTVGNHTVRLTINNEGCVSQELLTIHVDTCGFPTVDLIIPSDSIICEGSCVDFTSNAIGATSYHWSFLNGTPSTDTSANPTNICYNTPGIHPVSLTVTNSVGSYSTSLIWADNSSNTYGIWVVPSPSSPVIIQSGWNGTSSTLSISGSIPPNNTYQWYYDTGSMWTPITGATSSTYIATVLGGYKVLTTEQNGYCTSESNVLSVAAP